MSGVKRVTQALCVVSLALFAGQASAQDRPGYGPSISVAAAKKK